MTELVFAADDEPIRTDKLTCSGVPFSGARSQDRPCTLEEYKVVGDVVRHIKELQIKVSTEVKTPSGNIDILTRKLLIEVKCKKDWKNGVGQLICYGHHYKDKRLVLLTFDRKMKKRVMPVSRHFLIQKTCTANGIKHFHYTGNFDDFYQCLSRRAKQREELLEDIARHDAQERSKDDGCKRVKFWSR